MATDLNFRNSSVSVFNVSCHGRMATPSQFLIASTTSHSRLTNFPYGSHYTKLARISQRTPLLTVIILLCAYLWQQRHAYRPLFSSGRFFCFLFHPVISLWSLFGDHVMFNSYVKRLMFIAALSLCRLFVLTYKATHLVSNHVTLPFLVMSNPVIFRD